MTLVEVLAGSAILGTILVSILVADARLKTQARSADRRIEACRMADELLEGFQSRKDGVPRDMTGDIAGHEGWRWRTRRVESDCATTLDGEIVAVEVFGPGVADAPPAVKVEILVGKKTDEKPVGNDTR